MMLHFLNDVIIDIESTQTSINISVLKALPGKLDIKRHSPSTLFIAREREREAICCKLLRY